jgi:hypothetical protein
MATSFVGKDRSVTQAMLWVSSTGRCLGLDVVNKYLMVQYFE